MLLLQLMMVIIFAMAERDFVYTSHCASYFAHRYSSNFLPPLWWFWLFSVWYVLVTVKIISGKQVTDVKAWYHNCLCPVAHDVLGHMLWLYRLRPDGFKSLYFRWKKYFRFVLACETASQSVRVSSRARYPQVYYSFHGIVSCYHQNVWITIAGTLGCVFIDNETHESGVTKCTTGEAWSAFSWHHSSVFHCQWTHNQVFLLLSHILIWNAKSILINVMKYVSRFIWKLGINFAVCIKWIDETWWNNRLLLVPNCYEVVAMVATMVAMVAPLWCHALR